MTRDHWFEDLADHMGEAYDRYSHTKGTVQEVDHVIAALGLRPGERSSTSGAARAVTPTNSLDTASRFTASTSASDSSTSSIAGERCRSRPFERADRPLDGVRGREFDAVVCLCQGAFGMMTADGDDVSVVAGMARALTPGGRLALTRSTPTSP